MSEPATRHLTILLTDIKGFTDKTSHKSRADILAMLDEHRAVVLPILEGRGGHLIKTIGDAFLMTFDSPTNAVLAGVAVQGALTKRNEGRAADDRLEIRIAINAGEVNLIDNDVYGEAVNITARIEGIAEAGQVYFTEAVYLAMNKSEVPSSEVGLVQLKGIPEKIRVYKVRTEEPSHLLAAPAKTSKTRGGPAPKAVFAGAAPPSFARRAAGLALDLALCALVPAGIVSRVRVERVAHVVEKKAPPPEPPESELGVGDIIIRRLQGQLRSAPPKPKKRPAPSFMTVYEDKKLPRPWGAGIAAFALVWFAYGLLFLKLLSATPGQRAFGLKVVSLDGSPLGGLQGARRALVSVLSAYALFLGYLWALHDPQRRGWHDLAAGTRVAAAE